jgi:hypothetical protein
MMIGVSRNNHSKKDIPMPDFLFSKSSSVNDVNENSKF